MKKTTNMILISMLLLLAVCMSGSAAIQEKTQQETQVSYEWHLTEIPKGVDVEVGKTQFYTAQFSDGLLPVIYKSDMSYYAAYMRTDGTLLRGTLFDWGDTYAFSEGCGYVEMDAKSKGFINTSGAKLFDLVYEKDGKKYAYERWPGKFSEGLVRVNLPIKNSSSLVGYLNLDGNVVIDPLDHNWEAGTDFSNGYARVCTASGRWSIIDKTGYTVVAFDKGAIPTAVLSDVYVYSKGTNFTLASYTLGDILELGSLADCVAENGLILANAWDALERRVYDTSGKLIADKQTLHNLGVEGERACINGLLDGMILFSGTYDGQSGRGLLSPEGKIVCPPLRYAVPLADGYMMLSGDDGYGIADWNGKEIVPCRFEVMSPLSDGSCLVQENGKGYILTVNRITQE